MGAQLLSCVGAGRISFFDNYQGELVPKEPMRVARRFNAGNEFMMAKVPKEGVTKFKMERCEILGVFNDFQKLQFRTQQGPDASAGA